MKYLCIVLVYLFATTLSGCEDTPVQPRPLIPIKLGVTKAKLPPRNADIEMQRRTIRFTLPSGMTEQAVTDVSIYQPLHFQSFPFVSDDSGYTATVRYFPEAAARLLVRVGAGATAKYCFQSLNDTELQDMQCDDVVNGLLGIASTYTKVGHIEDPITLAHLVNNYLDKDVITLRTERLAKLVYAIRTELQRTEAQAPKTHGSYLHWASHVVRSSIELEEETRISALSLAKSLASQFPMASLSSAIMNHTTTDGVHAKDFALFLVGESYIDIDTPSTTTHLIALNGRTLSWAPSPFSTSYEIKMGDKTISTDNAEWTLEMPPIGEMELSVNHKDRKSTVAKFSVNFSEIKQHVTALSEGAPLNISSVKQESTIERH